MQYLPACSNPLRTRADAQRLVVDLVRPVMRHFLPGDEEAGIDLGSHAAHFGPPAQWVEALARPLWGLVPLAVGGGAFDAWKPFRDHLARGCDPGHPAFWGIRPDYDQCFVEMPILALGMALLPDELWHPLSESDRAHIIAWLRRINSAKLPGKNWLFFRVLVNASLEQLGLPGDAAAAARDFDRIDEFYLGDGWYQDGADRHGDYYVPMMHFYALLYTRLRGADPRRTAIYGERATRFAADFVHWFTSDGAALPFGRSLTYRCAQGAFWGALAWANVEALPWGCIRGLWARHVRWWMRRPIFSETGLLTVGYGYPNLIMAEDYNAPGSPYWALKAFLPLALPETHPFWTAAEEPLPSRAAVRIVRPAGLTVCTDESQRHTWALNAGQPVHDIPRHAPQKYSKLVYSTAFGFSVAVGAPSLAQGGQDSTISLSGDGRRFRPRDCAEPAGIEDDGTVLSRWQPWRDVLVETWLIPAGPWHVRIHRLVSGRQLHVADTGFALGYARQSEIITSTLEAGEILLSRGASQCSGIVALSGRRQPVRVWLEPNTHILTPLSAMPVLLSPLRPGETWLASAVLGWAGSSSYEDAWNQRTQFQWEATDHEVALRIGGVTRFRRVPTSPAEKGTAPARKVD